MHLFLVPFASGALSERANIDLLGTAAFSEIEGVIMVFNGGGIGEGGFGLDGGDGDPLSIRRGQDHRLPRALSSTRREPLRRPPNRARPLVRTCRQNRNLGRNFPTPPLPRSSPNIKSEDEIGGDENVSVVEQKSSTNVDDTNISSSISSPVDDDILLLKEDFYFL